MERVRTKNRAKVFIFFLMCINAFFLFWMMVVQDYRFSVASGPFVVLLLFCAVGISALLHEAKGDEYLFFLSSARYFGVGIVLFCLFGILYDVFHIKNGLQLIMFYFGASPYYLWKSLLRNEREKALFKNFSISGWLLLFDFFASVSQYFFHNSVFIFSLRVVLIAFAMLLFFKGSFQSLILEIRKTVLRRGNEQRTKNV